MQKLLAIILLVAIHFIIHTVSVSRANPAQVQVVACTQTTHAIDGFWSSLSWSYCATRHRLSGQLTQLPSPLPLGKCNNYKTKMPDRKPGIYVCIADIRSCVCVYKHNNKENNNHATFLYFSTCESSRRRRRRWLRRQLRHASFRCV